MDIKKILFYFIGINIIFLIFFLFVRNPPINRIYLDSDTDNYQSYLLTPQYVDILRSDVKYFDTDIPPSNLLYPLNYINEQFSLQTKQITYLELASKRVIEIIKWGDNIPVKDKHKFIHWQALMNRYTSLMKKEIIQLANIETVEEKNAQALIIRRNLDEHYKSLMSYISDIDKPLETKQELYGFVNSAHQSLIAELYPISGQLDPSNLQYNLNTILSQKDFGIYKFTLDYDPLSTKISRQLVVRLENQPLYDNKFIIDGSAHSLYIEAPKETLVENLKMVKKSEKLYQFTLNNIDWRQTYLMTVDSTVSQPVKVKIENVLENKLYPANNIITYQKIVNFPQHTAEQAKSAYKLTVFADKPFDSQTDINVKLIPLFIPDVLLEKIAPLPHKPPLVTYKKINNAFYEINFTNTSNKQQQYVLSSLGYGWSIIGGQFPNFTVGYLPYFIIATLLTLSFTALVIVLLYQLIGKNLNYRPQWFDPQLILKLNPESLYRPIKLIIKKVYRFLARFQLLLHILAIILAYFYVIAPKTYENFIILSFVIIWSLSIIGHLESKISFIYGLFFIFLCPFLLNKGNDQLAEKAAVLAFIFLCTGSIQAFVELFFKAKSFHSYPSILNNLRDQRPLYYRILYFFIILLKVFFIFLYLLIDAIFILQPKRLHDHFSNFIKLAFIITIFSSILFTVNFINQKRNRLLINPQIVKIEPKIVYPATKVIIWGKNFGWKENEKVSLHLENSIVRTDLWTDSKIIFTVPLHWKPPQELFFWIEKPVLWEGENIITKSKMVQIKLIPIGAKFSPEDETYFEQLKSLEDETLIINGYTQQ